MINLYELGTYTWNDQDKIPVAKSKIHKRFEMPQAESDWMAILKMRKLLKKMYHSKLGAD